MKIKIGSRASNLALIQSRSVQALLEEEPDLEVEIIELSTKGDRVLDRPIEALNDKGVFVREIEKALLEGKIDLAVHSMKDMPSELVPGLVFADPPRAASPEDVFVGREGLHSLKDLEGKRIGTGSARRKSQLNAFLQNVELVGIRGNIETRMRKIEEEHLDGIFLARAGLERAGYEDRISFIADPHRMIPSPCQGILALQVRSEDTALIGRLNRFSDPASTLRMQIERAFQKALDATCKSPVGIYTETDGAQVSLHGCFARTAKEPLLYETITGPIQDGPQLAIQLAALLKEKSDV